MDELKVGVFASILDGERLLLLHRSDVDMWCMPGGLLEFAESISDCLRRECREEIGTDVEIVSLLGLYSDPAVHLFTFRSGKRVQYVTAVVRCRLLGRPTSNDAESREIGWFAEADLPRLVPSHTIWIRRAFEEATGVQLA